MRMRVAAAVAAVIAAAAGGPVAAQAKKARPPVRSVAAPVQQVVPPKTVYWLSAATTSGFGVGGKPPSGGDLMRMAMGGRGSGPAKTLSLDLGSKLPPSGPPQAAHAIPPGMNMGASLALKTPKPARDEPSRETSEPREPPDYERPKGKILLFWGCGETARPGQPVVIDFAKLAQGQVPPNLFAGEQVRIARPPSAATWPTWGGWPNDDRASKQAVPANAALPGAHTISGNYTPNIAFTLTQDWMAGLDLTQTKLPSGALGLGWNAVPGATAHFAQMMGGAQGGDGGASLVFWSSSDVQTFISGLSDYIAPAEAVRLVGKKQLMPAGQTQCTIPTEAMAAVAGGLVSLIAHGPEENFVFPPRPADTRTPWVQEWAVKARFAARTGGLAGMNMAAMSGGDRRDAKGKCVPKPTTNSAIGEAIGGSVGSAIGGLFGKKKPKDECSE